MLQTSFAPGKSDEHDLGREDQRDRLQQQRSRQHGKTPRFFIGFTYFYFRRASKEMKSCSNSLILKYSIFLSRIHNYQLHIQH
jgi:hypothetical protein